MPLITWLRASVSGTFRKSARRNLFLSRARWHGYTLALEALEDRTLPSTFQWTGLGSTANWSNASNWILTTGSGSFPNAVGDIAQFVVLGGGAEAAGTTVTVDVPITVGEIDFGTSSSISITGANNLTLQANGGSALLDVGAANPNSGLDTIAAPVMVNAATPLVVNTFGSNSLSLSGQVSGGGGLTKNGTGTLTLNAAASNTYSGTTTVNAGTLTILGPSATGTSNVTVNDDGTLTASGLLGTLVNSASLAVNTGGTLELDNSSSGNNADRIGDTASLNLNGGTFTYLGATGASSTETAGNVTLGPGSSTISATAGGSGGIVALTFGTLTRNAGATVSFQAGAGQTLGSTTGNQIGFANAPSSLLTNGIVPWATVTDATGFNLATTTGTTTSSIAANTTFQTTLTGATSTTNVVLTDPGSLTLSAPTNVNSLVVLNDASAPGPTVINQGNFPLDLTSGSLVASGTQNVTVTGGTLAPAASANIATATESGSTVTITTTAPQSFSSGQTVLIAGVGSPGYNGTFTIISASPTTFTYMGSPGLGPATGGTATVFVEGVVTSGDGVITTINSTFTGNAGLTLAGPGTVSLPNANSSYSGTTTLASGTLSLGNSSSLSTGSLNLVGGTLQASSGGITVGNAAILNNAAVTFGGTNPLTLSGPVALAGANTITANNSAGSTIAGLINGPGSLILATGSLATLVLSSGANNYTGTTQVLGGALVVAASNAIPASSSVVVAGGSLIVPSGVTDPVAGFSLQGGNLSGGGTLTSKSTYDMQSGQANANLAGGVGLSKSTAGTVTLGGTDSYTGPTAVNAGTLAVIGQLTASQVNVTAGATLTGTGTITGAVTAFQGTNGTTGPGGIVATGTGTLKTGSLSLDSSSVFTTVLTGPGAGQFGQDQVTGAVNLNSDGAAGSTLIVTLGSGFTPTVGQTFNIITNTTAPANGTFKGLPAGSTFAVGGETFSINYAAGSSGLTVELKAVAGPPAQVAFGVQPSNTTAGAAIAPAVTVMIEDQFGNVVSSDNTDQVTVAVASGPGSFSAASTVHVTVTGGIATFSNLQLNTAGTYTLSETATGSLTGGASNSFTVTPAAVNQLTFGVQPTNTTAGAAIAPAVTVQIEDQFGNVVTSDNTDTVTLGLASGPGSFSSTSTLAAAATGGIATFANLHLNTAGGYKLSETATAGLTGAASNSFTVTPAAANQLIFGQQPTNTTAGTAMAPAVTVRIEDPFGNLVSTDSTDTVTVGIAGGPGTFTGTSATTVTASNGVATFSNLHLNTAGTYTLSETATGSLTGPVSNGFTVTPAAANQLVFGQPPTSTTAGATITPAVTVQIEDQFGNLVTGDNSDQVTVGLASGPGSFSAGSATIATASGGVATFSNLHINTAGSYTLSETATGGLTGVASNSFTVTPAAANQLVFGQPPTNTTAGAAIAPAVTVRVEDQFGNVVTSDNTDQVTVGLASGPGSFAAGSTTTVTASGGVATLGNLHLNTAGSYTLSETASGGLTGPVSNSFTVTPAAANQLVFSQQPTNTTAGTAVVPAVTVKIEDQFGNVVTGDNTDHVTLGVASGPGSFSGTSTFAVIATAGITTFSNLHLNTAGTYTLSEAATGGLTGPASTSFTVTPAAPNQLVFGGQPTNTTAGAAVTPAVTVLIEDQFGNVVTGDSSDQVTVGIASGPGTFAAGSITMLTANNGAANYDSLVLNTAGSYTLSETATGSLTGASSNSFTITPAAVNQLGFGQQPTSTTAGAALAPAVTVQIEDQFGNVVTGDSTDTVTVGIASGPGSFSGSTTTVTASGGIATFVNLHLNTVGTYTLSETATGGLTGPSSSSFTVTPAAANQVVFGQQLANSTAGAALAPSVTVKIEDTFGNLVSGDNSDQVTVGIASGPGSFSASSTTTVTASGGVATLSNLHLNTAGSYTLSETATGGLTGPASTSFAVTPAAANQLAFGQQPSNTTAGTAIAPAVTVQVEDQFGNLVSTDNTDQVTIGIASGPGTFSGSSAAMATASGGIATFGNLHLNSAGSYTLSETATGGLTGAASNSFTVTPAAANQLVFGVQPANTTAGAALAPAVTVKIEDQFGNLVSTDSSDTVTVGIASGPGPFSSTSTTTVTASAGVGTFSNLHLNTAGSYTLSGSGIGGGTGPFSSSFTVTPAAANQLVFGQPPTITTAGAAIAPAVTVKIEDAFGNLVTGDSSDQVTVGVASGPGSFSGSSTTTVTASGGVASFNNLQLNTAGSYTLSETATGGLTGAASNSFTVTPAAANRLAYGVQPTNTTGGAAITPAVTVQIEDPFGNVVTSDSTDQVTVGIASGPGIFTSSSTTTVTASSGVATFANLHLNTAGSYTLSETAGHSLSGPASSTFAVTPASPYELSFSVQPSDTTAGAAIAPAVTVQIEDSNGNLVTTDNTDQVTVSVASGPGSLTGSSTTIVTASGGIATFSNLLLNTAGTYTLSESASGSLTGPASNSFTVTPAAANQLVFGQQPTNTTAGAAIAPAVTVKIEDRFGNLITGDDFDQVVVGVAGGPGSFSGSSTLAVIAPSGIATFSNLHLNTAGSYTLSETFTGGFTGPVSASFTVTPAAANRLVFAQQPSNTTAGSAITPAVTVQIEDQFGNVVTSDGTDTVTVGIASGPASFSGSTTTVTASGGTATFANLHLNTPGSYTLSETASGGLTGPVSNGFTVTPGAANQLVFGSQPTNTTAGALIGKGVTVEIEDAFGNLVSGDNSDQVTIGIASGPGSFSASSATTATASGGMATFFNLHLNTAGTYTLSESASGGLTGPASTSFSVTPAAANQLGFGQQPSSTTAGAAIAPAVTVRIEDQFGNLVSTDKTDLVMVGIASGPGSFSSGSVTTATASGGIATFSNLLLDGTGTYTLSESATGSLTGPASSSFTVTPAAANQLIFGQQPAMATAGAAITPVVTVLIEDRFGNLVTSDSSDTVTVGVAGGPGSFSGSSTTTVTASGGVASFSNLRLNTPGSYTLSESATGGLTGANSNSFTIAPTVANQLAFGVQPGNTSAGTAITPVVTVQIEDAFGDLVSTDNTDMVTVGIAGGPGSFSGSSTTTVTASGGIATFANLHLNTAGTYTLSETASGGLTGPASIAFTVTPAAANQLVFGVQPGNTTAGAALGPAVTVKILDQFGNLETNDSTDQVTLTIASGPGGFSGNSTTTATASAGVATFSNLRLNTAGTYTLSEAATGSLSGPTSNSFTVTPAAVNQLVFGVQPTNTTAGVALAPAMTVKIEDPFGNVVTSDSTDTISLSIASGPGSFSASSTTTVTASAGIALFDSLHLNTTGTYVLGETATGSLTGPNSNGFTVTSAAANHLVFGVQPTNTTAGTVIAPAVTVKLEDPFGNLASGDSSSVTIALAADSPVPALQGTLTIAASGGVATFGDLSIPSAAPGYTLTASAAGVAGAASSPFAITAAAATHLLVLVPSSTTAGSAFTFTVTALDPFNNPATDYSGTVHFSSSDVAAVLPADAPLPGGIGTFNATFETAGLKTLTATDTVLPRLSASSVASVVSAANATQLVVNVPSSADADSPVTVTVNALDMFNNPATGYTGTVHFTSSDPLATLPANYTFTVGAGGDNGTHAFSVTFGTPVNQTLSVTDLATGQITSTTEVPVLPAGAIDPDVEPGTPGRTATAFSADGLTTVRLTVFLTPLDEDDVKALTAILPLLTYGAAPVAPADTLTLAAYEVRVLHGGDGDVVGIVFMFPMGPDPTEVPVVQFSENPLTIPLQPIQPSRMSFFRNGAQGIIALVFNNATLPTVRKLDGTVFTVTINVPTPPVPVTFTPPVASTDAPAAGLLSTASFQSTSQLTLTLSSSQASQVSVSRSTLIPTGGGGGDDITAVRGDTDTAWLRILVEALGDYAETLWQYGSNVLRRPPRRSMAPPPTSAPPASAGPKPEPPMPPDESMGDQDEVLQRAPDWSLPEAWFDSSQPGVAEWATMVDPGPAEPWWGLAASLVGLGLRVADASADEEESRKDRGR